MRVIVPFTAGGAPDVLMRLLGQKLSEKWGQGVVVENRAGGNTLIGTVAGAKAAPDGYTMTLAADQTFVLNPLLYSTLPYSMKEFEPVVLMGSLPHMLAVANKVPVPSVKELIALAKAKPDTLTYGTTGPGTIQRIAVEYFSSIAGIKLVQVPYKGANETTTAILSGEIDMTINGMSNILPHIAGGKLKALAISTVTRHPLAPDDADHAEEAGVPGYSSAGRVRPVRAGRHAARHHRQSTPTLPRCWRRCRTSRRRWRRAALSSTVRVRPSSRSSSPPRTSNGRR